MTACEILFLFNHDAAHQVAHLAPVVRAMAQIPHAPQITCATGTPAIRQHLEQLLGAQCTSAVQWLDLSLGPWAERMLTPLNRLGPVARILRLARSRRRLCKADILISTERTCLAIRRRGGKTRFVYVPHGAGDRAVSFHPGKGGFDLILVAGDKTRRELVTRGVAKSGQIRITGYPKFDTVKLSARPKLFENDQPVILYNPHFDPFLSSWYDYGPALVNWFANGDGRRFNLILAPHIMLFAKKIHVSPEYRLARRRPDLEGEWAAAPNVHIDISSNRLIDMTYTLAADAYIGDVSSQVYEFMIRPRPICFLDGFSRDPRSREGGYPAWKAGPVFHSVQTLTDALSGPDLWQNRYAKAQWDLLTDTFSHDPTRPAGERAALAILDFMQHGS